MGMEEDTRADFDPGHLVVETASGLVLGDHKRGAYRFKGIPFAAPPIGALRFAPPTRADSWTGQRDATGRFPIAPQPLGGVDTLLGAAEGPEQSEANCLTLNVWTPAPDGARRPVMVWIHGGAFVTGTGLTPWYDGARLTTRDVVVVTINYRLGALGFLHLADLADETYEGSGNAGLLDQAMALSWVHDNIEAFGGNPSNVTIFGESAGAMSVASQLALPASNGLFHRAIAESGAASNVHDRDQGTEVAVALLDELGLGSGDAARLRDLPVDALLDAQQKISARLGITSGLPFQPTVDGTTLPQLPQRAVADGAAADIELLAGTNRDELKLFTAMDPNADSLDLTRLLRRVARFVPQDPEGLLATYQQAMPDATPRQLFEAIGTDAVFRMPVVDLVEPQSAHAPSWLYEFHRESTSFGGTLGAAHAVEIPFVFDNLDAPGANFIAGEATEQMRALATQMADAWTRFAHTGDPNGHGLPTWDRYRTDARTTMIFDIESASADDPAGTFRDAWRTRRA